MTERQKNQQIRYAADFAEEMRQIILSVCEDIPGSRSMTEAWGKIDRCYADLESLRNRQKCTGAKSLSVLHHDVEGHTKYLQGLNLPIKVNSVIENDELSPSDVSEMHVANINGTETLLITPEIIG